MDDSEITVRPATMLDLPALLSLYRQLAGDSARVAGRAGLQVEAGPADERAAMAIFREIDARPDRTLLVALRDDHVVGTADLLVVSNLTHRGQPWSIVENVVVQERARRSGVGAALMLEVEHRARAAGCYKVQLLTRKERVAAHAFYEALGYEAAAEGYRRYFDSSPLPR